MFGAAAQKFPEHQMAQPVTRRVSSEEVQRIQGRSANDNARSYGEGDRAQVQAEQRTDRSERVADQPASPEQVYQKIEADLKEVGSQYHQLDQLRAGIQQNLDNWGKFIDTEFKGGRNVFQYAPQMAEVQARLDAARAQLKQLGEKYYGLTQEIEPFDQLRESDETLKRQATESVAITNEITQTEETISRYRQTWEVTVQQRNQSLEQARVLQQGVDQYQANVRQYEELDQGTKEQIQLYKPYAEHPQYRNQMLNNGMTYAQYVGQLEEYRARIHLHINHARTQLVQADEQYTHEYRKYASLEQQQGQIADQFLQAQAQLGQLYEKRHSLQSQGYQLKRDRPTYEARVQGVVNSRNAPSSSPRPYSSVQ